MERHRCPGGLAGLGSLAALRVWALLLLFREPATGQVDLTREDIAGAVGLTPRRVSRILTALRNRYQDHGL